MRANLVKHSDFRHYDAGVALLIRTCQDQELKLLILWRNRCVFFCVLYLDPVFACICASKYSQPECDQLIAEICQLCGPFNQLLVAAEIWLLCSFCRMFNWTVCMKRKEMHIGVFFFYFYWLHFSSQSDLSWSSKSKNCLNMNLLFGADRNSSVQGESPLPLFRILFSRECVCCFRDGSLPTSLIGLLTPLWDESMLPGNPGASGDCEITSKWTRAS